jgi:hypothetical protein
MRILDIITEAHVFKQVKNQYTPGYRMTISTQGDGIAIKLVQAVVKDYDPRETLTISDQSAEPDFVVELTKATPFGFKLARKDGKIIELKGSKSAIETSLNGIGPAEDPNAEPGKGPIKMPNKGDTAEALLGLAMFAKFLNRSGGAIGNVDADATWALMDHARPVNEHDYMVHSKDLGGANDTIWLRLKVKNTVIMALQNQAMRKKLTAWLQSPINYVNSAEGTEYAEEFYKNGTPDEIGVISDGLSAQKDKKTDVVTAVRDPKTNTVKREIMPISLKAGHDQFAQHSGGGWKAMMTMFGHLGIVFPALPEDPVKGTPADDVKMDYEGLQGQQQQVEAASKVYAKANQLINAQFTKPEDEATFIQTVAHALRFWATNDDDNVQLVSFGRNGKYDVLQFSIDKLTETMKELNLRSKFVPGENPKLEIYDAKSGNELFRIRTYLQTKDDGSKYQRNVIEKGPLLSIVADITGRNSQKQTTDVPATVPATTPAKTKSKVGPAKKAKVDPRIDNSPEMNMDIDPSLHHEPHPDEHISQV